ncbi:unnamed protein product, partial [Closterium sp. NIES-53]
MPGSGGTHRQISPARDLSGVRELVTPRVRQAAEAALGGVRAPALLTSVVAGTENGRTTALLLLARTTTGPTPLRRAVTSSTAAAATSATSTASATASASATSTPSAPSATAAASSSSTAATYTSTSTTTPTTTPTSSIASTSTSTTPTSPPSALAPLPLPVRRLPLGADAVPTDSKPPRSAAAAEAIEGKRGEGEHPSKTGVRGSPREAPTATMLVSAARRRASRRST